MEITRVMVEKDNPDKGQRLATATVVFGGVLVASGFSIFPDRHKPGRLRVLFPARRFNGETTETLAILDPTKRVEVLTAIIDACEAEGIKAEAKGVQEQG